MTDVVEPPQAALSPAKRALLEARLKGMSRTAATVRRTHRAEAPASFAQERLWVIDRLDPGSTTYNVFTGLRISGDVDEWALERALGELVRRQEALRTTFCSVDGVAVQVVAPFAGFTLPVDDLSGLGEEEAEVEVRRAAGKEAAYRFDLAAEPLFRTRLLRLGRNDHALFICTHHIVTDGWSQRVLFRELWTLYAAYAHGRTSPLAELPAQYVDFALWQREQATSEAHTAHLAYWKSQLAGVPGLLNLPTDFPRPSVPSFGGGRVRVEVSRERMEQLRELGRREGATLFMVILAAFKVLLARYGATDDVVVGSPMAGRRYKELEDVIGLFVNTLVLRTDLSGDPRLRDVVDRVRDVVLGAYEHQDVPLDRIVAEVRPERSLSHATLFQVAFQLVDFGEDPPASDDGTGLRIRDMGALRDESKLDLTLSINTHAEGLSGVLNYSTDLFEHDTAARMVRHLDLVLEQLAGDPDRRLSGLDLLDDDERHLVLEEWNRTARDHVDASGACLHVLFQAQAARAPEAEALRLDGRAVTYRELDEASSRLAHHLAARGVRPESRVGIFAERAPETMVAILAILKAGGAYVPLDPASPVERLRYLLADSGIRTVIAPEGVRPELPGLIPDLLDLLDLRAESRAIAARPATAPDVLVHPDGMAYVISTSGSTGRPKGVMVEHGAVVNVITASLESFEMRPGTRILQGSSLTFDASVLEIFIALLGGGTLVLVSRDTLLDAEAFGELLRRERVEMWVPTPALLKNLDGSSFPELRTLAVCGDRCPAEAVAQWAPGRRMLNIYGPTESTIYATSHHCSAARAEPPPVGRPVTNVRAYVLDGGLRPVPAGLPGEVCLGGVGVSRGYLGRPTLTAERFVPDPYGAPGARLYRTGDKARWRPDGTLDFIGRLDEQVKLRGMRVEPGEVEAVLRRHEGVADCAVIAREDGAGDKRLVAYVVPVREDAWGALLVNLREHLREHLPEYMVPSAFVRLESFPLTPHGKLDRRALPAPVAEPNAVEADAAPRTPMEETLAAVWADVLGIDAVGVHDHFFNLGGDSILAIQVVSRAARAGVRITARQIFQHQSVAELALHAQALTTPLVAEAQAPVVGPAPLVPIQRAFFARGFAEPWHWNMAQFRLASAPLDPRVLERAVAAVLEHHDALRLRFSPGPAGEWRQSFAAPGGAAPVETVDFTALEGNALSAAIHEHASRVQASLDLARGPVTRVVLYRGGTRERDRVLWIAHHLVIDSVSWRILLEDLETAYGHVTAGEAVRLPPRTTSYRRWAERLISHARTPAMRSEADWWLARPWETAAPLPTGTSEGKDIHADARQVVMELDDETTRALLQEVPPVYGTQINDVLLVALARALGRWTGGRTVAVELEGHGREELFADVDLTRTVGWFTSTFPVLLEAEGDDPGALLRGMKERLREIPARGVGFGILRWLSDDEGVRERLASIPWPEVSFNYLSQFGGGTSAGGEEWLSRADGASGSVFSPNERRTSAVEVLASVRSGRLRVAFVYPGRRYGAAELKAVTADYEAALREIVEHCRAASSGYAVSGFPVGPVDHGSPTLRDEVGAEARGVDHPKLHLPLRGERDEEAVRHAAGAIPEQACSTPTPASPVVPLQPKGSLPPLFLVHPSARGVVNYVNLVRHLGTDQAVYAMQDLGEDPGRPMERFAAEYVEAIRSIQPNGPYYLCGWSFGAYVVFEMARLLEREGEWVAFVGLLDTITPDMSRRWTRTRDMTTPIRIARVVAARMRRPFSVDEEKLEGMGADEQIRWLLEALHAQGVAPEEFAEADLRDIYEVTKARHRSIDGYAPGRFAGRLTLFRAYIAPSEHEWLALAPTEEEKRTLGWSLLTEHRVEVCRVPGSHTTMMTEPHVGVLAQHVREALAAARERAGFMGVAQGQASAPSSA
ncbi:amino acid adenylation domain-containing protein [Longimicrobium sp.]|uniref:amino acid adenylation domain-containing protein n=1 Tax=Longimicrobium sp. TaxID=2029185 RepID=UPI003B3A3118